MDLILSSNRSEALTALANGTFLTLWNGAGNVPTAQFFNADGTKKGSPIQIAPGSEGENLNFSATSLSDGRFVVVWQQKGAKDSVFARIFSPEGNPAGEAFKIESDGAAQTLPQVTALKNGGFAVASINEGVATTVLVDANGVQKQPILMDQGAVGISTTTLSNGNVVSVVELGDAGNYSLYGYIHTPDSVEHAAGELIPGFNDADRPSANVTALSDGGFLFIYDGVWDERDSIDLYRYTGDGQSIGTGTSFGSSSGESQSSPVVKALPTGGFAFAYTLEGPTGTYVYAGMTRFNSLLDLTATQIGSMSGDQSSPQITILNDGRYVVSWVNVLNGVAKTHAEILDPRLSAMNWVGTALSEQFVGTLYSDRLNGGSGNDTLTGGGGDDTLVSGSGADRIVGGTGSDTYYVDNSGDRTYETSGGGTSDRVYTALSHTLASHVEKLYASGASSVSLTGNTLSNTITGNSGANRIQGGLGNDLLRGGTGKDKFVFDTRPNKSSNVDQIYDFKSRDDGFYLDNKYFTKLGTGSSSGLKFKSDMFVENSRAQDREDRIVYDRKKGYLYYDQDGTGSKAQVKIATISNKEKLYYHDFYVI